MVRGLVSIVVPVYNTVEYVEECIKSVLNQTYTNWELILVNDGSTDGSEIICEQYTAGDDRIKLIHQKNGGQSKARNEALTLCSGEFYVFLDSEGVDKKLWYNALFFLLIVILYYISTGGIHMDDIKSPSAVTIGELSRIVKEFEEKIQNGTEDPDRFLTLTEIEELWGKLIGDTNVLYSDMLQSLIQNIDERELVRQKKENSRPEE